ncbi:hypothetical protein TWF694_009379 [Orbilia ellipsospora]|uniref:Uncharacterized protein n=1 Tax=Orbilia ellipsospora TaxID=2528407 RepID=A0AAV9XEP9_9PEZI
MKITSVLLSFLLSRRLGVLASPAAPGGGAPKGVKLPGSGQLGSEWEIPPGFEALNPVDDPALVSKGLHRRAEHAKTAFKPTTTATLEYRGASTKGGAAPTAKVRVQVDKNHPILELSHLKPLVEHVELFEKGPDKIGMVFRDDATLKTAFKAWDWINNKQEDYFVMIAMVVDPKNPRIVRRLPYKIDNVEQKGLKVTLRAKELPWDSVGVLDIRFGGAKAQAKGVVTSKGKGVHRRLVDGDAYWPIPVGVGTPKTEFTLFSLETQRKGPEGTDDEGKPTPGKASALQASVELKCVGCYTEGSFDIEGHFHWDPFSDGLTEANVAFRTTDISVNIGIDIVVILKAKKTWRYQLIGADVAGLAVAGMANFGPSIALDLAKEISVAGKFSAGAKMKVSIPNDEIYLDLVDTTKIKFPNWKPRVEWDFDIREASVELKGTVGTVATIGLTGQIFKQGFKSGLEIWVPKFDYGGKVGFKENFCPAPAALRIRGVTSDRLLEKFIPITDPTDKKAPTPDKKTPTTDENPTPVKAVGVTASASAGIEIKVTALQGTGALSGLKFGVFPITNLMIPLANICKDARFGKKVSNPNPFPDRPYKKHCSQLWQGTAPFCSGECPSGFTQVRSAGTGSECDVSTPDRIISCHGFSSHSCWTGSKVLCERCYMSQSE